MQFRFHMYVCIWFLLVLLDEILMTFFSTCHFLFPNMESVISEEENNNNNKLTFYKLREKRLFDLSSTFMPLTECYVDVCECLITLFFLL